MLKFNYFLRAIRGTEDYLEPLDTIISDQFLPALCDTIITDLDRQLFKLPIKGCGMGIPILSLS